jgi:hypothetical protein
VVYSTSQSAQGHYETPAHNSEKPIKAVISNPIMHHCLLTLRNEHTPAVPREQEHFAMSPAEQVSPNFRNLSRK